MHLHKKPAPIINHIAFFDHINRALSYVQYYSMILQRKRFVSYLYRESPRNTIFSRNTRLQFIVKNVTYLLLNKRPVSATILGGKNIKSYQYAYDVNSPIEIDRIIIVLHIIITSDGPTRTHAARVTYIFFLSSLISYQFSRRKNKKREHQTTYDRIFRPYSTSHACRNYVN